MKAPAKIAAARYIARQKLSYFASPLLMLAPRPEPGLGTIGTSARAVLLYDPEAVEAWSLPQLAGALVHEVMHLVLKHHTRVAGRDAKLWNIAGDLSINTMVKGAGFELPDGGVFPADFGLPDGKTADWYYEQLVQKAKDKQGKGQEQEGQGQGEQPAGDDAPHVGKGYCGGCAGRPVPGEPSEGDGDPADRSDAELGNMCRQVAEAVRQQAAKNRGNIPGELLRWAEEFLAPPKVRWQDKLAKRARASVGYAAGLKDYTYSRPSRRALGSAKAGDPIRPSLHRPVPRVAIVVDTSGSMGSKEIGVAVRESRGVLLAAGAEVEFLACDAKVHSLAPVRSWKQIPALIRGGGGTDFRPAFAALEKPRGRAKADVVVFITDGYGPAPDVCPTGMNVIWLLVGANRQKPCEWGTVIEVDV